MFLIFFFTFLAALPISAQSGMGGVIEGLSRPSGGAADWMVRASSLSPADLASLLRRSVFGASRSEALVRLSEKNSGGSEQLGMVFSPGALRRLNSRSESTPGEARRLLAASQSAVRWGARSVSNALSVYVDRSSQSGPEKLSRLERHSESEAFYNRLRRRSIRTSDLVRRRSLASEAEHRVIRRLSVD